MDTNCNKLKQCLRCVQQSQQHPCTDTILVRENGTCGNDKGTCGVQICQCFVQFAANMQSITPQAEIFHAPLGSFEPNLSCHHKLGLGGPTEDPVVLPQRSQQIKNNDRDKVPVKNTCCLSPGDHYKWFNPERQKCCDDGEVKDQC